MNLTPSRPVVALCFAVFVTISLCLSFHQEHAKELKDLRGRLRHLSQEFDTTRQILGFASPDAPPQTFFQEEFRQGALIRVSRTGDRPEVRVTVVPDIAAAGFVLASSSSPYQISPDYFVGRTCDVYQQCTYGSTIYHLDRLSSPTRFVALKIPFKKAQLQPLTSQGQQAWLFTCEPPDADGEVRQLSFVDLEQDRTFTLKRLPKHLSYTKEKFDGRPTGAQCPSGGYTEHIMGDGVEIEVFRAEDFPVPALDSSAGLYTFERTPSLTLMALIDTLRERQDLIGF